jgi:pilus assembly protein CpaB
MFNLPKGISYMGVAVVLGLLATFGIHSYVSQKTYVPPVATAQVVVAASDISPGNALAESCLKMTSWPKELIPPHCASALNQVEGRVATTVISSGEPILFSKLAPVGTAAGLSSLLDEDKRAVTVKVDEVTGVAGFIHPRDKVDVLADLKMHTQDNFSKVILQNITVLSIGQTWEQKPGDNKPAVVNAVTLEVTPDQAEILNLASNEGKIRLALRGRRNEALVETSGVATSHLFAQMLKREREASAPAPVPDPPKPQKAERSVEVIKGCEISKTSLGG